MTVASEKHFSIAIFPYLKTSGPVQIESYGSFLLRKTAQVEFALSNSFALWGSDVPRAGQLTKLGN
jgi:hypothetical protein